MKFARSLQLATALSVLAAPAAFAGDGTAAAVIKITGVGITATAPNRSLNGVGPFLGQLNFGSGFSGDLTIWCVDFQNTVGLGNQYNVNVTGDVTDGPLGTVLNPITRMGNANRILYKQAAYLASQMALLATDPTAAGLLSAGDKITLAELQAALWQITSGGLGIPCSSITGCTGSFTTSAGWSGATAGTTQEAINTFIANSFAFANAPNPGNFYDFWYVISDARIATGECNPDFPATGNGGNCHQEFLVQFDTPREFVPEPATMTLLGLGLVGLAVAGRSRRRKS